MSGTTLDESNVRKALNRLLDAAELHRRGPHQMRHTFASQLLQDGAPITYVRRQLGHKDAAITLPVYAHWLPDESTDRLVDLLDDTHPSASQAHPDASDADYKIAASALERVVSQIFTSWNQLDGWLRQVERLRWCLNSTGARGDRQGLQTFKSST